MIRAALLFLLFLTPLAGQDERASAPSTTTRVPVKIVAGRLIASVELSTVHEKIGANLFVDFDQPVGLNLANPVIGGLKAVSRSGEVSPVSVHFPDFAVEESRFGRGDDEEYQEFTRLHSREMDEMPLAGTIGANFLNRYVITFDLESGVLELEEASGGEEDQGAGSDPANAGSSIPASEEEGVIEVSISTRADLVWLPIQLADGVVQAMAVTTTTMDSLVDQEWCDRLGHPAGDVGVLNVGSLDLSAFVAFRPAEVNYAHPDGAIGTVGLNLLQHLRLTIDRGNKVARISVSKPADFPVADRAFFAAMVEEDAEKIEAWLGEYPQERLSQEAATLLLGYRMDEDAEPELFEKAIRILAGTWRKDMKSTRALDLMRDLRSGGYPIQAVFAGEQGIEGGRDDRYPNSVHQLHASMGEVLLDEGEDRRAWRHLLSAAFGLPEDGLINLKLGQFYEKQKRYNRALSRYVQAVITVEAGEKAVEGLTRVQKLLGEGDTLSVDTIEPLIAGKAYSYSAATRFREDPDEESNRVTLVEFFTNAHIKHPTKEEGAIGGALGNEGVMTFFPRSKVAMLAYHLPHPRFEMDSLTNELAQATADAYGAPPAVQVVDGRGQFPGTGHVRDAEKIYKAGRAEIQGALSRPSA
ncbi:MAG: hypothetical protein AAF514_10280, partial [Verrucomicrobiota bacterium]